MIGGAAERVRLSEGDRRSVLLVTGFIAAIGLRLIIGGAGVSQSPLAGVAFAACLLLLAAGSGVRITPSVRSVSTGVLGAVVLCLPVALGRPAGQLYDGPGFTRWAVVVTVVAVSEEVFLRGALYDAVTAARGSTAAVTVGAVAFALLHVPLYGWHVVPLDLFVGVFLGELRRRTGTPAAPAITHAGADLAAWFMR
jgi:membrane protease YdiL (CAAX protease family)